MAREIELSDYYSTINELQGTKTNSGDTEKAGATHRRLLRNGILTLGVLCAIQVTLNISLRLVLHFKEDSEDQFPFNSSTIADMCQIDQQNSTESCSCYKNLLRRLLREYKALERERDILRDNVDELTMELMSYEEYEESGSGIPEEFYEGHI